MTDARVLQAREHHQAAARLQQEASRHRQLRNQLICALRAEDPQRWTYRALAAEVGCTFQLIRYIVERGTPGG